MADGKLSFPRLLLNLSCLVLAATASLPLPASPVMRTGTSVQATCRIFSFSARMPGLSPVRARAAGGRVSFFR